MTGFTETKYRVLYSHGELCNLSDEIILHYVNIQISLSFFVQYRNYNGNLTEVTMKIVYFTLTLPEV